jgi:hypothetical protein
MNHLFTVELAMRDLLVDPGHHRPTTKPHQHTTHHQENRK